MPGAKITSISIAMDKAFTAAGHKQGTHLYKEAVWPGGAAYGYEFSSLNLPSRLLSSLHFSPLEPLNVLVSSLMWFKIGKHKRWPIHNIWWRPAHCERERGDSWGHRC
jgi:hypothetical protein